MWVKSSTKKGMNHPSLRRIAPTRSRTEASVINASETIFNTNVNVAVAKVKSR